MASVQAQMMTADALRITLQDIDKSIEMIRRISRRGWNTSSYWDSYIRDLRWADCLREQGIAQGCTGPLFEPFQPTPINEGFVGLTRAEKFKREWKIPAWMVPQPVQFREAAE
ncbi:hypothetical protein ABID21_001881 [Pseudorhizobium tarimense]|uniref:Uncharacterized protein n=1 Tax=Pseudorhizobium tarimense TaxID=1079109 RepID=A0ABV2H688_9HYPH|nr:hypothetical protein [Pseudorhizobium tarimense]MCJ8518977.1 hypothetical protein [Pseudorhizobium tarimense]